LTLTFDWKTENDGSTEICAVVAQSLIRLISLSKRRTALGWKSNITVKIVKPLLQTFLDEKNVEDLVAFKS